MSRPNAHGLPHFLRKDDKGYFLDFFTTEGDKKKRKRVRLGHIPLAQAKMVLAQHMQAIVKHRFLAPEPSKIRFFEAGDAYLAYCQSRRIKTFRREKEKVVILKDFFKDIPLEQITPDFVERFFAHRRQGGSTAPNHKGKMLANGTLNQDLAALKAIVRRAMMNGRIERNPIAEVRKFKANVRSRTLEPEEYRTLLSFCKPELRPVVQVAYMTGMRCGEILNLRWEQVDLRNGIITLEAADTKTKEKREVPLDGELLALFNGIPKILGNPHVFPFYGHRVWTFRKWFKRAVKAAGIRDFVFHDLRHCAITNLRKAGVSDSVIMSISGHKTHDMFRRYDRIDREDRLRALQAARRLNDSYMTPPQPLEGKEGVV